MAKTGSPLSCNSLANSCTCSSIMSNEQNHYKQHLTWNIHGLVNDPLLSWTPCSLYCSGVITTIIREDWRGNNLNYKNNNSIQNARWKNLTRTDYSGDPDGERIMILKIIPGQLWNKLQTKLEFLKTMHWSDFCEQSYQLFCPLRTALSTEPSDLVSRLVFQCFNFISWIIGRPRLN
jgi:hypothetical protein